MNIGRCAFNINLNVQENVSNIWLEKVMGIFVRDFDRTFLAQLNRFFPNFGKFWACTFHCFRKIGLCQTPPNLWIIENAKDLIHQRSIESKTNVKDILQLLFEATNSKKVKLKTFFQINCLLLDSIFFYRIIKSYFCYNGFWF